MSLVTSMVGVDCGVKPKPALMSFSASKHEFLAPGRAAPFRHAFLVTLAISAALAYKLETHIGNEGLMSSSAAGRMSEVSAQRALDHRAVLSSARW